MRENYVVFGPKPAVGAQNSTTSLLLGSKFLTACSERHINPSRTRIVVADSSLEGSEEGARETDNSDVSYPDDGNYLPTTQELVCDSSDVDDTQDLESCKEMDTVVKNREARSLLACDSSEVDDTQDLQSCKEMDTGGKNREETNTNWEEVCSLLSLQSAFVSIPAVKKKANGKRLYNKKHYCFFCDKPFSKMARHLEQIHSKDSDVAYALSFNKGSKPRKAQLELLRNKGNFAHNARVMEAGTGTLVTRQLPQADKKGTEYLHCVHCQGNFSKGALCRHMKNCPAKQKYDEAKPDWVSDEVWTFIGGMNPDSIAQTVQTDRTIMMFAENMYNTHGSNPERHKYICNKTRELGRLVLHGSEVTPLKNLAEYLMPINFEYTVKATLYAAVKTKADKTALSLPLKLGRSLHKCALLQESAALTKGDKEAAEAARDFKRVYSARWHERVSGQVRCLKELNETRWNAPLLLPLTEDIKKLHDYLEEKQKQCLEHLKNAICTDNWKKLCKVTQTLILLFNRRRQGEVSKAELSAFMSRVQSAEHEDINYALSDLEIRLCRHFFRLEIKGQNGKKVPVLLSPSMVASLELLCARRSECDILDDNHYLFAVSNAETYYKGCVLLKDFVNRCGLKNPSAVTGTRLRKHVATLSTVLNLKATELEQLADFMEHNIGVHANFHRLPESTLQLAKISKVLMAMEQGRCGKFQGKDLDEIDIAPNEIAQADDDKVEGEIDPGKEVMASEEVMEAAGANGLARHSQQHGQVGPTKVPKRSGSADKNETVGDGRPKPKRTRQAWTAVEKAALERHFQRHIVTGRVPDKAACSRCLEAETVLEGRKWKAVKFFVHNKIHALKKTTH